MGQVWQWAQAMRTGHLVVQVIEAGLVDGSRQGGANAASLHAFLHDDDPFCLLYARGDGFHVEGF